MNQYKEQYENRKNSVLAFLNQTIAYLRERRDDSADALEQLRQNVMDDLFGIVLVGEFSAGKSTFLNALMRRRILPSFTSETTATINFLRHKSNAPNGEPGIVYYQDGHTEVLPDLTLEEIEKVVSTRGDTRDTKIAISVDHVDLFLDSDFLEDGVMLVDSPGLNGVADHHREITEQQIKASHASIFMFSADHPGSKTDFEYLRDLKSQSKNIFFVLNKINVIRESEGQTVESVVEELRQSYRNQFPDETELPKIWPVAGDAALAARDLEHNEYHDETITSQERRDELERLSRLSGFEDRLWRYLSEGERTRAQLTGPVESCLKFLNRQQEYLSAQVAQLSQEQSGEEIQNQKDLLESRIAELKRERKNTTPELRRKVDEVLRNLKENAEKRSRGISQQVAVQIGGMDSAEELQDYAQRLDQDLSSRYHQMAKKLDEDLRDEFCYVVQEEYEEYFSDLENQFEELSGAAVFSFQGEKLVLSDFTISSNLEQFENWSAEMRKKIEEQEAQADQLEQKSIAAMAAQRKISVMRDELNELKEREKYIRDNFVIPDVVYRTEEQDDGYWRSGLFGWIGNALFGKKSRSKQVTVSDDTAQKKAQKDRDDALAAIEVERNQVKADLRAVEARGESPEVLNYQRKKAQDKLEDLEKRYVKEQEKFTEKLKQNAVKVCTRLRNEVQAYTDRLEMDFQDGIVKYLTAQKQKYLRAVGDMVNISLDQELQKLSQQLGDLIHLMETEGEERQQRLEGARQAQETARRLLEQGAELSARLEIEMDDHVEQEAL